MQKSAPLSRRGALRIVGGTRAVSGAATAGLISAPSAPDVPDPGAVVTPGTTPDVGPDFTPGRYRATPVLHAQGRHLLSRFTPGVTPSLTAEVRAAGGAGAWFRTQLEYAADPDRPVEDGVADWWPDLHLDERTLAERDAGEVRGGWEVMTDYSRRLIMRRILSPHPVLEVMCDFWENHLHVPADGDPQFTWRARYGDVVRRHALGRYDDLLVEAITHPAMLIYLDGAISTKTRLHETLGRELLELHTVGPGVCSEDDVLASARILTGHRVDVWRSWAASYQPGDHWTGAVEVLDFHDPNTDPDGRAVAERYLRWLARHPLTAQRIARKLAIRFVEDAPAQRLVDHLAQVYLDHDTAIEPVVRALVASPQFHRAVGAKLRDPAEDVVATHRALGTRIAPPTAADSAAQEIVWQTHSLGLVPMTWPGPDGQPTTNDRWSSPSRTLASANLHWSMAGAWWPRRDITYRQPADWLPEPSISFRDLVDHLSRLVLQRPSTSLLLRACCESTETDPLAMITPDHPLVQWKWPRLLVTLLDSPAHLRR